MLCADGTDAKYKASKLLDVFIELILLYHIRCSNIMLVVIYALAALHAEWSKCK